MKAKDLWKKVLTSYFESDSILMFQRYNANRSKSNSHGDISEVQIFVQRFSKIQIQTIIKLN